MVNDKDAEDIEDIAGVEELKTAVIATDKSIAPARKSSSTRSSGFQFRLKL